VDADRTARTAKVSETNTSIPEDVDPLVYTVQQGLHQAIATTKLAAALEYDSVTVQLLFDLQAQVGYALTTIGLQSMQETIDA